MQFFTKEEEKTIKKVLDELATRYNLSTEPKEVYRRKESYYLDRLWWTKIGKDEIPVVAFEIEKSLPSNERIRKDVFNLAFSRAPLGYLILPHTRIMRSNEETIKKEVQRVWVKWYKKEFTKVFNNYYKPFSPFIEIKLVDADEILKNKHLQEMKIEHKKSEALKERTLEGSACTLSKESCRSRVRIPPGAPIIINLC